MKKELKLLTGYLDHANIPYRIEQPLEGSSLENVVWQEAEKTIRVSDYNIAWSPEKGILAWMEDDNYIYYCLKMSDGRQEIYSWIPESHNLFFGVFVQLITWIGEYLLLVYKEKHETYICSIKDGAVKFQHYHGDDIAILQNRICYRSYREPDHVFQVSIPDLAPLPVTTREALSEQGIVLHHTEFTNFYE